MELDGQGTQKQSRPCLEGSNGGGNIYVQSRTKQNPINKVVCMLNSLLKSYKGRNARPGAVGREAAEESVREQSQP